MGRSLLFLTCVCGAGAARVAVSNGKLATDTDLKPFEGWYTADKTQYDPLTRYSQENGNAEDAKLIIKLLEEAAAANGDEIALRQPLMDKNGDLVKRRHPKGGPGGIYEYRDFTWRQYHDAVLDAAGAFVKMGLQPMDSVHIRGVNSPEWMIAFLGCVAAGGLPVGLYPTDSPDTMEFKAKDSKAVFIVVGKVKDLRVYSKFVDRLAADESLKAIVHWDNNVQHPETVDDELAATLTAGGQQLLSWNDFMDVGLGNGPREQMELREQVAARIAEQNPGQAGTVVYTSGTTGNPKGVMLSQDALTWTCKVFERDLMSTTDEICAEAVKGSVARNAPPHEKGSGRVCKCDFGQNLAGGDGCDSSLRKFSPWGNLSGCYCSNVGVRANSTAPNRRQRVVTYLPLNHIAGQMLDIMYPVSWTTKRGQPVTLYFPANCFLKKTCFQEQLVDAQPTLLLGVPAVWNGLKAKIEMATASGLGSLVAGVAPSAILAKLGLGSIQIAVSGAGPINKETLKFFHGMGIQILNVFGQSESSALGTAWNNHDFARFDYESKFGSIGRAMGNVVKILDPDDQGRGEIALRGRNVMLGYLNNEAKTKSAFDSDGWLLTGDQGVIDEDGFISLTGRLKEIMKDLGGEMILPVQVEEGIKKACNKPMKTIINEVVVVGDGEYYISALFTLMEDKPEGLPSGDLVGYAKQVDPAAATVAQAKKSEIWASELAACIGEYNAVAVKSPERVYRYYILPKDMTPEDSPELVTPTLKIKRTGVVAAYEAEIQSCGGSEELKDRTIQACSAN